MVGCYVGEQFEGDIFLGEYMEPLRITLWIEKQNFDILNIYQNKECVHHCMLRLTMEGLMHIAAESH